MLWDSAYREGRFMIQFGRIFYSWLPASVCNEKELKLGRKEVLTTSFVFPCLFLYCVVSRNKISFLGDFKKDVSLAAVKEVACTEFVSFIMSSSKRSWSQIEDDLLR